MKILIILSLILVSHNCMAETFGEFLQKIQMQEKQVQERFISEYMPKVKKTRKPIRQHKHSNILDCGVKIETGSLKQYEILNKLCSDVLDEYKSRFPDYTLPATINVPVSFLPKNVLIQYFGRMVDGETGSVSLDGFTKINYSGKPIHFYVLSDWKSVFYFKTVFAHELFHVLNALSNRSDCENDAENFTESIGLGR
jgi:hypothetical protein